MKILSLRMCYFWGFVACTALYSYSIYLQIEAGLHPCPLCVLQRFSMVLLAFTFLMAFFVRIQRTAGQLIAGGFSCLFSVIGIIFSGRQVWLQHLGSVSNESCGASLQYMLQVLPFEDALKNIFKGSTECSQIGWQFLSLSLSEWSLLSFGLFLLFSLWQTFRKI